MGDQILFQAKDLTKSFKGRAVVDHVSLEVRCGEIVGLLGKNGAGKTTTFRMIIGMLTPDRGHVFFQGEEITSLPMYERARKGVGYLAQEPSIFRHLTVEKNVLSVLEARGFSKKERREKADQVLENLGISHLKDSKASTLSGGERRRLEISRVMSLDPQLILLDEPFAGVDPIAVSEIKEIVSDLKKLNIGILLTDHNARETLSITDRSYILEASRILTSGTTEELLSDTVARESYLGKDFRY